MLSGGGGEAMVELSALRERDSGGARGVSTLTDMSTSPWAAGIPLKRATLSDREGARNGNHDLKAVGNGKDYRGAVGNGKYKSEHCGQNGAREATQLSYKGKSPQFRTFKGEAIDGGFCRRGLGFYKVATFVIALCFLTITVMQGSVIFIVNHTDFLTIPRDEGSRSSDTLWILPETMDLSDCDKAVRSAVENFTEHLLLKASISELSKLERDSYRPPQLALFCPPLSSERQEDMIVFEMLAELKSSDTELFRLCCPQICPNLEDVPDSLHLGTIARGLQQLGYRLELYGQQDGPLRPAWEDVGIPVHIVQGDWRNITVDWSNFEGVLAVSLDAKKIMESLAQEPFTDIPVLWIIDDYLVLDRDIAWNSSAELQAVYISWLETFNRSSVVVFPNYFLPMVYSDFYSENFFVVPGSPRDVWEAEEYMLTHTREDVRAKGGLNSDDYVIVLVGSPCSSTKSWREHAIVMKAVANLLSSSDKHGAILGGVRLLIFSHGNSNNSYDDALQLMAKHVGLREGAVKHVGVDRDIHEVLWVADTVVYGSTLEELSFPPVLIRAMSLKRPVIVPNLRAISQQVEDCRSGFLFPAGDDQALGQVLWMVKSNPILAQNVGLEGASLARTLLARDAVVEYGYLLEKVLDFPGEAHLPRPSAEMQEGIPEGWQWKFLRKPVTAAENSTVRDLFFLKSGTDLGFVVNVSGHDPGMEDLETAGGDFDLLTEKDLSLEMKGDGIDTWEQAEDEMMKDRLDRVSTTFEEVNKMAKKTETRVAQDKHLEIDQFEVERVAQPLCIYEPYYGSGAWSFLHRDHLLYHSLSLSPDGRRPYLDDVDGASRLRLLNDSYYRDVLCDVAGFFAIAKLIDRVHKNLWIGFQPWRAVSKKVALGQTAETALLEAVSTDKYGDALYFWAQLESKNSQPTDDFWSACDFANAGNCRTVFYDTFKQMHGLPSNWTEFPPLPRDGGTWAAMHCWAMPTTSFLEFVMFARMFVNALDALQYEDHHDKGRCCFKVSRIEVKHCYCNFLEGLVNIWAYHSARRMIYLDPQSGLMREQHDLGQRTGQMWVKWFRRSLLKSMDEDLAEEADEGPPDKRWLWPDTGEVYWDGTKERDRIKRFEAKVEKKRKQLERRARQIRYKQRPVGGRYGKQSNVAEQKFL